MAHLENVRTNTVEIQELRDIEWEIEKSAEL